MERFARVMCVMLCILMTAALFGACGDKGENSSDNDSLSASEYAGEVLSKSDVNFAGADGNAAYRVVRPDEASEEENQAAIQIYQALRNTLSLKSSNVTDKESGDGVAEILIGNTNRESTAKAKQLLLLDGTGRSVEYIICTIDDDIVIYGMSDAATATAAQYFVDNYMKSATVAGGINYFYNAADDYTDVKIGENNIKNFQIVRPIYNVSYLTQTETNKLIDKVSEKTGYTLQLTYDNVASNNGNKTDGSGTLTPTEPAEYEIIIGNCLRDGVNTISDYNKYEIRIEDKKVYLNGGSAHSTAIAVSEFIKLVEGNDAITASMNVHDGDYEAAAANYDSAEYYKPTFWDDFDYSDNGDFGIDYEIWTVPWGRQNQGYSNAADGRIQFRNSKQLKNVHVDDGRLYMEAMKTDTEYWGGWFDSTGSMFYRYGYLETSSLHPKGMGFWSCLWLRSDGDQFSGIFPECVDKITNFEIDVDECYGQGDRVMGNTGVLPAPYGVEHFGLDPTQPVYSTNNRRMSKDDRGYWMDYHTYGFEWVDNSHLRFTCDGDLWHESVEFGGEYGKLAWQCPAHLIVGFAVGSGNWGEPTTDPDEWANTNKFVTDWIHIYQKTGQDMLKVVNGKWTVVDKWNTN